MHSDRTPPSHICIKEEYPTYQIQMKSWTEHYRGKKGSVKPGGVRVRGALKEYVGPPYEIEGEIVFPEIFDQMYAPLLVLSLIQIPEANLQKLKKMDPIDVEMGCDKHSQSSSLRHGGLQAKRRA
ncbi:hypothetical protein Tco_1438095 [Tanacetum coccineum]